MTDQFASRPASLSGLALAHMIPPEKITDTQIGVATWLLLWWTVSGYAGSFVTMGLHQHADWWNLVPYTGPRASLPHTAMFPVRKRKNPQKPPHYPTRNSDRTTRMLQNGKCPEWGFITTTFTTDIRQRYAAPSLPPATLCSISVTSGQLNAQDAVLTPRETPVSLVQHPAPRRHAYEPIDG